MQARLQPEATLSHSCPLCLCTAGSYTASACHSSRRSARPTRCSTTLTWSRWWALTAPVYIHPVSHAALHNIIRCMQCSPLHSFSQACMCTTVFSTPIFLWPPASCLQQACTLSPPPLTPCFTSSLVPPGCGCTRAHLPSGRVRAPWGGRLVEISKAY